MWHIAGWVSWSIVALLAIGGAWNIRTKAKSGEVLERSSYAMVLALWIISIFFLVFDWHKLHVLWVAPIASFIATLLVTKKVPIVAPLILLVTRAFLAIAFAGIKKRPCEGEPESQTREQDPLERYKRIRQIGRELTGQMMEHVPGSVLMKAANDLRLKGRGKMLVFDSEEDTHFMMDRCFHDIYWEDKNLIQHFIESDDYQQLTEEEQAIVQGMATAYYSLFEILDVDPSKATLELKDLLGQETYAIIDVNLSLTAQEGSLLAGRIKQVEGIYMTTGVACPFHTGQKQLLLDGLKPKRASGKKRKRQAQGLPPRDYSAYFFKQYKRIGGIEFRTSDDLE